MYLAENADTTLKEVGFGASTQGQFQATPLHPYLVLSVKFKLQRVLDISTPESWETLKTTRAELSASWRDVQAQGQIAFTQQIGITARTLNLEAIVVLSVTDGQTNLVVFPDNLYKGSFIEVYDPNGKLRGRLEGYKNLQ